jgi:hypothetical protein
MKRTPFNIAAALAAVAIALSVSAAEQTPPEGEAANSDVLYVDRMDAPVKNDLGGRNSVYIQSPSRAAFSKAGEYGEGDGNAGLKIVYDKKNEGGPRGDGGFCGYYSLLHRGRDDYFDASPYKYVVFWVKGEKGGETFKVGAADRTWAEIDDSVKSQEIGKYLPSGKVTTDWQLAVIPIDEWFLDWKQMHAFAICFEADVFETGAGQGTVFIDDFALTRQPPVAQK